MNYFERNGYHDSDFIATVWDEATKTVKDVMYDTTRCGGSGSATIDATEEVIAKANNYVLNKKYKHFIKIGYKKIAVNQIVTVVKGRKVKKGTVGTIAEVKANDYDEFNDRITLMTADGKQYTYAKNLEVMKPTIHEIVNVRTKLFSYSKGFR